MLFSVQKVSWITCFGILHLTSTNIINELHVFHVGLLNNLLYLCDKPTNVHL